MVIINSLLDEGKTVVVPIIETRTKTLRLSYLKSVADLEPGTFHVPEPLAAEIPADIGKIEIALLPLIGFDRSGNRIAESFDRKMDWIVTENRIITCNPARPRI